MNKFFFSLIVLLLLISSVSASMSAVQQKPTPPLIKHSSSQDTEDLFLSFKDIDLSFKQYFSIKGVSGEKKKSQLDSYGISYNISLLERSDSTKLALVISNPNNYNITSVRFKINGIKNFDKLTKTIKQNKKILLNSLAIDFTDAEARGFAVSLDGKDLIITNIPQKKKIIIDPYIYSFGTPATIITLNDKPISYIANYSIVEGETEKSFSWKLPNEIANATFITTESESSILFNSSLFSVLNEITSDELKETIEARANLSVLTYNISLKNLKIRYQKGIITGTQKYNLELYQNEDDEATAVIKMPYVYDSAGNIYPAYWFIANNSIEMRSGFKSFCNGNLPCFIDPTVSSVMFNNTNLFVYAFHLWSQTFAYPTDVNDSANTGNNISIVNFPADNISRYIGIAVNSLYVNPSTCSNLTGTPAKGTFTASLNPADSNLGIWAQDQHVIFIQNISANGRNIAGVEKTEDNKIRNVSGTTLILYAELENFYNTTNNLTQICQMPNASVSGMLANGTWTQEAVPFYRGSMGNVTYSTEGKFVNVTNVTLFGGNATMRIYECLSCDQLANESMNTSNFLDLPVQKIAYSNSNNSKTTNYTNVNQIAQVQLDASSPACVANAFNGMWFQHLGSPIGEANQRGRDKNISRTLCATKPSTGVIYTVLNLTGATWGASVTASHQPFKIFSKNCTKGMVLTFGLQTDLRTSGYGAVPILIYTNGSTGGAGATINITGFDAYAQNQTWFIDVSNPVDTVYNSSNASVAMGNTKNYSFSSITNIDCGGLLGNDLNITVRQPLLGLVKKVGNYCEFAKNTPIVWGVNSSNDNLNRILTPTCFKTQGETVYFSDTNSTTYGQNFGYNFSLLAGNHKAEQNYNGSTIIIDSNLIQYTAGEDDWFHIPSLAYSSRNFQSGTVRLYNSKIISRLVGYNDLTFYPNNPNGITVFMNGNLIDVRDTSFETSSPVGGLWAMTGLVYSAFKDVTFTGSTLQSSPSYSKNVKFSGGTFATSSAGTYSFSCATFGQTIKSTNAVRPLVSFWISSGHTNTINFTDSTPFLNKSDAWFNYAFSDQSNALQFNTINLKAGEPQTGNAIPNATCLIRDSKNRLALNATTGTDGTIGFGNKIMSANISDQSVIGTTYNAFSNPINYEFTEYNPFSIYCTKTGHSAYNYSFDTRNMSLQVCQPIQMEVAMAQGLDDTTGTHKASATLLGSRLDTNITIRVMDRQYANGTEIIAGGACNFDVVYPNATSFWISKANMTQQLGMNSYYNTTFNLTGQPYGEYQVKTYCFNPTSNASTDFQVAQYVDTILDLNDSVNNLTRLINYLLSNQSNQATNTNITQILTQMGANFTATRADISILSISMQGNFTFISTQSGSNFSVIQTNLSTFQSNLSYWNQTYFVFWNNSYFSTWNGTTFVNYNNQFAYIFSNQSLIINNTNSILGNQSIMNVSYSDYFRVFNNTFYINASGSIFAVINDSLYNNMTSLFEKLNCKTTDNLLSTSQKVMCYYLQEILSKPQGMATFSFLDGTGSSMTVSTVNQSSSIETPLLNMTFSDKNWNYLYAFLVFIVGITIIFVLNSRRVSKKAVGERLQILFWQVVIGLVALLAISYLVSG